MKRNDDQRGRGLKIHAWYVLEVTNSPVENEEDIKTTECYASSLDFIL